jgi:hypothetical protein
MRELEAFRKYLAENKLQEINLSDDDIRNSLAKAFNISPDEVALSPEESKSPTEANEAVIATALTIAGLIPIILNGIGVVINFIKQKFGLSDSEKAELEKLNDQIESKKAELKNVNKQDSTYSDDEKRLEKEIEELKEERLKKFGTKLGKFFIHAGHDVHEAYVGQIEDVLGGIAWTAGKFGKKLKIQDEAYRKKIAEIIYSVIMITAAGTGIASHIAHLTSVQPVLTTIVEMAKGGKSISDIVKTVITVI